MNIKNILLMLLMIQLCVIRLSAQDVIVKKDGSTILSKVLEVNTIDVKYKKASNPTGPTYTIMKSGILSINYENGEKEMFDGQSSNLQPSNNVDNAVSQLLTQKTPTTSFSTVSQALNKSRIDLLNKCVDEYDINTNVGKKAHYVWCLLSVDPKSQLINDDIEVIVSTNGNGSSPGIFSVGSWWPSLFNITLKNKSGKILYIDLGNSFFMRGSKSQILYVPTSTTTGKSKSGGGGINLGSITNAAGIGGVVGTIAGGINIGGEVGASTSSTTYSQRIIALPQYSSTEMNISMFPEKGSYCSGMYIRNNTNYSLVPYMWIVGDGGKHLRVGDKVIYNEENSPISFSFIVSYSFNERCETENTLTSKFYLSKIVGFHIHGSEPSPDYSTLLFRGNLRDASSYNRSTFNSWR